MRTNKGTELKIHGGAAECSACHEVFNSASAFDQHRKGTYPDRVCRHPESIGMDINKRGYWAKPMSEEVLKARRK